MVLRCFGRKPLTVRPGEALRIGRHASNDLVLNHATVSRFHAVLRWDPDEDRPWIEDKGSANGIELDGEPVDGRTYVPGTNEIGIGDYLVVTEYRAGSQGDDETAAALADGGGTVVHLFNERRDELSGIFEHPRDLQAVLIELEAAGRTGTLTVRNGTRVGRLTLAQGLIMSARQGEDGGMRALHAVLLTERGQYAFTGEVEPSDSSLSFSIRSFLAGGEHETLRMRKE